MSIIYIIHVIIDVPRHLTRLDSQLRIDEETAVEVPLQHRTAHTISPETVIGHCPRDPIEIWQRCVLEMGDIITCVSVAARKLYIRVYYKKKLVSYFLSCLFFFSLSLLLSLSHSRTLSLSLDLHNTVNFSLTSLLSLSHYCHILLLLSY